MKMSGTDEWKSGTVYRTCQNRGRKPEGLPWRRCFICCSALLRDDGTVLFSSICFYKKFLNVSEPVGFLHGLIMLACINVAWPHIAPRSGCLRMSQACPCLRHIYPEYRQSMPLHSTLEALRRTECSLEMIDTFPEHIIFTSIADWRKVPAGRNKRMEEVPVQSAVDTFQTHGRKLLPGRATKEHDVPFHDENEKSEDVTLPQQEITVKITLTASCFMKKV